MIITKEAEVKIRKACQLIPDVEWSGVLFYTVSGTFEDNTLEVKVVDLFPMDIGSTGYTEFLMSPDVTAYMIEHPELMTEGVYRGLIH